MCVCVCLCAACVACCNNWYSIFNSIFQVLFQVDLNFTRFFVASFALVCINIFLFKFLKLIFCIMAPLELSSNFKYNTLFSFRCLTFAP